MPDSAANLPGWRDHFGAVTFVVAAQVPDVTPAYNLIDRGGVVALLLLGIVFLFIAFQFGWIVPKWVYQQRVESEQAWRQVAEGTVGGLRSLTEEIRESNRSRRDPPGRRQR